MPVWRHSDHSLERTELLLSVTLNTPHFRCGNVAAIMEISETMERTFKIFNAAAAVGSHTHPFRIHEILLSGDHLSNTSYEPNTASGAFTNKRWTVVSGATCMVSLNAVARVK
ncbi:hypothetical protein DI09_138p70 [Mitosporidium daphniae]|uniref:Uncharacterized protein n=1 Tax=Mitosporidium daphniae TaxID=1485682 RepID=A0A098VUG5_9MICR|nr:uncharacterized protein DI09_138p70 [Mitosporidium daphniae]KGG52763.1 hypothetical protein DI09_138p70 [Mitosporidium daphniae]|eukprot:XP_013239199.1 uncharacterized protein DI09_138p70 [Mitosporidium daphniae]